MPLTIPLSAGAINAALGYTAANDAQKVSVDAGARGVGSFLMCAHNTAGTVIVSGNTYAGSSLSGMSGHVASGSFYPELVAGLPGTWRAVQVANPNGYQSTAMMQRIA